MRMDLWQSERERAVVLPSGIRVLIDDLGPRFLGTLWLPRAKNPTWRLSFRTAAELAAKVATSVERYDAHKERQRTDRAQRSVGDLTLADPGAIFSYSWGYDQTQTEFWQVIERRGTIAVLREISCESVPESGMAHGMADRVRPVKDSFVKPPCGSCGAPAFASIHAVQSAYPSAHAYTPGTPETITKRISFSGGRPSMSMPHGTLSPVKVITFGNAPPLAVDSHYRSWYA